MVDRVGWWNVIIFLNFGGEPMTHYLIGKLGVHLKVETSDATIPHKSIILKNFDIHSSQEFLKQVIFQLKIYSLVPNIIRGKSTDLSGHVPQPSNLGSTFLFHTRLKPQMSISNLEHPHTRLPQNEL